MEKFIIVAGTTNTGKTATTNLLISDMLSNGYKVNRYFNDNSETSFWSILKNENPVGGSVVLEKDEKKIVVISYGDCVKDLQIIFNQINFDDYFAVVCCARTRSTREVFDYFHDIILNKIDMEKIQVVPIYKDLIANHGINNVENKNLVNTILTLLHN